MNVSLTELRARFSHYLALVASGEHIVILRRGAPVAELVPHRLPHRRGLGRYAGKTEALERILDKDWGLAEAFEDGAV